MASGTAGSEGYKVIVVGSSKVGKSSLIQRFLFDQFSYEVPQMVREETKVIAVKNGHITLKICDLAAEAGIIGSVCKSCSRMPL